MTMSGTTDTIIVEAETAGAQYSYIEWGAIIAGIVLAVAISLVMIAFGSAVGLSFANFHNGGATPSLWVGIAAASWLLWVQVSSLMAGGYLTGRMRRRAHDATEHESDVRDGAHGLLVWGGAVVLGAILALSGVGAATSAIGGATSAIATAAGSAAAKTDPSAYFVDTLFRPAATTAATPASTAAPAGAATAPATSSDAKAEATRILGQGAVSGSISDPDKTYLGDLVARTTGMPVADAKTRVDQVLANVDAARQKAADAAEAARTVGVVTAFLVAAALFVSAAGAYWAAMQGGNHRDEQTEFRQWFRRY
jgi:hypothetical protein